MDKEIVFLKNSNSKNKILDVCVDKIWVSHEDLKFYTPFYL